MAVVFCQQWEESDRDCNVRPDGYSLHLTIADAQDFIFHYMESQKYLLEETDTEIYVKPRGKIYRVLVSEDLYIHLLKDINMRFNDNFYPDKAGWQQ